MLFFKLQSDKPGITLNTEIVKCNIMTLYMSKNTYRFFLIIYGDTIKAMKLSINLFKKSHYYFLNIKIYMANGC